MSARVSAWWSVFRNGLAGFMRCAIGAALVHLRSFEGWFLAEASTAGWGPAGRFRAEGPCHPIRRVSDGEPLSSDAKAVSWWACQSGCRPKGLVVVVTRETAAGTFSLVCTSVRAVSEGGAEQRDGMPALMGQYHQKFDFWPKRRSLPSYHGLVKLEGL